MIFFPFGHVFPILSFILNSLDHWSLFPLGARWCQEALAASQAGSGIHHLSHRMDKMELG